VDGDSSAIALLPALCYLNESTVTELREQAIPRIRVTKSAIDGLQALSKDTAYWDAAPIAKNGAEYTLTGKFPLDITD
jgi:hypothetical protein